MRGESVADNPYFRILQNEVQNNDVCAKNRVCHTYANRNMCEQRRCMNVFTYYYYCSDVM